MAKGQDEPSDRDDGKVLAPDELDISDDEHVAEIEEGRYVVSPNDPIDDSVGITEAAGSTDATDSSPEQASSPDAVDSDSTSESTTDLPRQDSSPHSETPELTDQQVREFLAAQFDDSASRYGFHVTATFDGPVRQRQMMSNDVVTIFESLILWYAQHIDSNTPVEEVLGILLMESNVPIRYPPESFQRLIKSAGLTPEDSIADLLEAIGDQGVQF